MIPEEYVTGVVRQFYPKAQVHSIQSLSGGHINQTIKIAVGLEGRLHHVVLQKLNNRVFKLPTAVMENTVKVCRSAADDYPLELPELIYTENAESYYQDLKRDVWRLFSYMENTTTFHTAPTSDTIFKAGSAFGAFLYALREISPDCLHQVIPNFHSLSNRFNQLQVSMHNASNDRRMKSQNACDQINWHYRKFEFDFSRLPIRAVHNDCKLANLLFDESTGECRAVIDLDTVMAGVVVTDFGDMVRSLCSTVSEEETNLASVAFDPLRYVVLKNGFLQSTENWLTLAEKAQLFNGAIYIVLEQAIRFLTDFLNNDIYYGCRYADNNYNRACNQLALLASMYTHEDSL